MNTASSAVAPDPFRTWLWDVMAHGRGGAGLRFHLFLLLAIVLSLALLPLEFVPYLHENYSLLLLLLEVAMTALFTVEYALRIYASPNRSKFIFSFYGIVDLLSILPFYLGFIATDYLRVLRLLRIVRIVKLGEYKVEASTEQNRLKKTIGLMAGEAIEFVIHMHPLYLVMGCVPTLVATSAGIAILLFFPGNVVGICFAVSLFIFSILFLWRTWLDFTYNIIYVTSHRMLYQNQFFFGRSINQVNYQAITNVVPYYRSFLGYFMGYGSIKIETNAAESGHTELHMVRSHEKAAHLLMEKCYQHTQRASGAQPHPPVPQPPPAV